ncbi:MAG TPA: peptidyl-alpha-hydroxyglycine alpha-amidating lyase family protein [Steroidobacteraceae bacterium]|jgi:streptogramin lyase
MKHMIGIGILAALGSISGMAANQACAEGVAAADTAPTNSAPNPYRAVESFFKLPAGRTLGSSSAVAVDHEGHIWIADRCGANNCAGSKLDPVMEFDARGNLLKSFGSGLLLFPHGLFIDKADHIWITDGHVGEGKGDDVLEFDRSGKVLLTLGKPGISGNGPDTLHEPSAVLVAPNGTIFVADGHEPGQGNARIVKFDAGGKFIKQWGEHGSGPGQFEMPHTLGMDSKGRLFVGDRGNDRIQIFDQEGKLLAIWRQFSRPSGLFIDRHDVIYVTDSESRDPPGYGYHPGWKRGIRIGSVKDGSVTAFIPDSTPDQNNKDTSGGEGVTADGDGNVYSANVQPRGVVKYAKQ